PHSTSTSIDFQRAVATDSELISDCLVIAVCSTIELVNETWKAVREKNKNAVICETPQGVINESAKNPSETLVVCTTAACFEGWNFVPRTRKDLRILVFHHPRDTMALELACDLANP
ncbi:hypothetical protein PMAYCL1PPCAC_02290, partial [Pristionchus mayeri]